MPLGVISSFGFAASTFGPKVLLLVFALDELPPCGPKQYVKAPDEAPVLLPILLQKAFLVELVLGAAAWVVDALRSATPPTKAVMRVPITRIERTALLVSNLLITK